MKRHYFDDTIQSFVKKDAIEILGNLSSNNEYSLNQAQKYAWEQEISILQNALKDFDGHIFFEFVIPRMGRRIDVLLIIKQVIFVLEFKIGEKEYFSTAIDQVWDYALDLKNFHETSHEEFIAPILISTDAKSIDDRVELTKHNDSLLFPIRCNKTGLTKTIQRILFFCQNSKNINAKDWIKGRYKPTPTIIEAAIALYNGHGVNEIARNDASAENLSVTTKTISELIVQAKKNNEKIICFVTGVPGAGKTLVGLNIATQRLNQEDGLSSVFLSGNGPLVAVLREALTRDRVNREKAMNKKVRKGDVMSKVKMFIQNVHHYRDAYLKDQTAPFDHIAIFDEAQRAWNLEQTVSFMSRKKGLKNFHLSEPEFLISCLDRHEDWAVIVCLVGGGQEINTGEAGISEWILSLNRSFPHWKINVSNKMTDSEYAAGQALTLIKNQEGLKIQQGLHLSVSQRSFRAEDLSFLVKSILDIEIEQAQLLYKKIRNKYSITLTRSFDTAKKWVKEKARGSERYGLVVSSQAQRLKPYAIDVKTAIDPVHWFLDEKDDVRSSYYLEDVATEFHVQGLELDWSCVAWDGDFIFNNNDWEHRSFVGKKWQSIHKAERKKYQKNAYRVLLTRARQGMVIVVPEGNNEDPTRKKEYYDTTFNYLQSIGFDTI